MSKKMDQSAVYRQLSTDMRQGLKDIYQQIATASKDAPQTDMSTDTLFHEASDQLDEVLKATEAATMKIMEIVERHMDIQAESAAILDEMAARGDAPEQVARLREHNALLGEDLGNVLTSLSFQDITGQRIKRVVTALNQIESKVVELYVSSGLMLEGARNAPEKDPAQLQTEARKAVEDFRQQRQGGELKGPDKNGFSQSAIDDMLSQLGM